MINSCKMLPYFALFLLASWSCLPMMVSSMTREYYIAAVERNWNYAPSGQNKIKGVPLDQDR